jgi:hypothetical protein
MGSRKHKEELLSLVSVLVTSSFLKPLLATRIPSEERKKRRKRNESTLPPFPQFLGFPPQTTLTLKKYYCYIRSGGNKKLQSFLLAIHKHTNIPTITEPFPPPVPWF